jgi:hypothetical protein
MLELALRTRTVGRLRSIANADRPAVHETHSIDIICLMREKQLSENSNRLSDVHWAGYAHLD